MTLLSTDEEMDAQAGRSLAAASFGAADVGEVIVTAARITPGDYDSWFAEWDATATRTRSEAEASAAAGHRVSAAQANLRASEYWRQAIFFIRHDLDDERLQRGWRSHRDAFVDALDGLPFRSTVADIPFEGATMRGYLFVPPEATAPVPVVVAPSGYDSTAEAGLSATGYMALARGMGFFVFEGPGQGGVLYEHRMAMRADFEVPLAVALDWLETEPGVDASRLALVGRSFAGYLAPRGAAFEDRIAALVCDPGQYDPGARLRDRMGDEIWQKVLARDPETETELQGLLDGPRNIEFYGARMATQGAVTFGDWCRINADYSLVGCADRISCPTLVTEGEGDFASQSHELFDALTCEKLLHTFSADTGAGGHCEGLGQRLFERVVFDWLDETLARVG